MTSVCACKQVVVARNHVASSPHQAKIAADLVCLRTFRPLATFPEFTVAQSYSSYGMKAMAHRYLNEMYAGLRKHRDASPRLRLFAAATHLFDESEERQEGQPQVSSSAQG